MVFAGFLGETGTANRFSTSAENQQSKHTRDANWNALSDWGLKHVRQFAQGKTFTSLFTAQ